MTFRLSALFLVLLFLTIDISVAGGKGASGGTVTVRGHVRKDGTYVPPHHRTAPDGNFQNNWSTVGNYNPYTGEDGKVVSPPSRYLGSSTPAYAAPLYSPPQSVVPKTTPALPADKSPAQLDSVPGDPLAGLPALDVVPAARPAATNRVTPSPRFVAPEAPAPSRQLSYVEQQKVRDTERAQFWAKQGYSFNPAYMTAYSMDQKVRDIERARFWQERGYTFSAEYMTAYSMDQKVRDIERARFWSARGLTFDPNYMTAYSMDREAERRGAGR